MKLFRCKYIVHIVAIMSAFAEFKYHIFKRFYCILKSGHWSQALRELYTRKRALAETHFAGQHVANSPVPSVDVLT